MEKASVAKHSHRIKQRDKHRGNRLSFIHDWDPKYKLRAKENVVHDSFGRGSIRHSINMPSKVFHKLVVIVATSKARLKPSELMSGRLQPHDGCCEERSPRPARTGMS